MTDITDQLNSSRNIYGGSDLTNPAYNAASKSLNLSSATNTIGNATGITISTVPFTITYEDSVGLFGAENYYTKVNLNIVDTANQLIIVNDYSSATREDDAALLNTYYEATEDDLQDLTTVNDFEPALREAGIDEIAELFITLNLENEGTGNIYNDRHIEANLYDAEYNIVNYENPLVLSKGSFFLGVHCYNTRRIPYKITITIGESLLIYDQMTEEQRRQILA